MKNLLISTALVCVSTIAAQAQSGTGNDKSDCDRLIVAITQKQIANSPLTLEQARVYKRDANDAACHKVLADNNVPGADAAHIQVQQPAANIQVTQPTANVQVRQAQPQVTVHQVQPEITVHQPAPTVTVDIPRPEITIRMPRPDVDVAMAKPQVEVNQAQPKVSVVQPQDSAKVSLTGQNQNAAIDYDKSSDQPQIKYEREKAKVVVNQPDGQPKISVVRDGQGPAMAAANTMGGTTSMSKDDADMKAMSVSNLVGKNLYNLKGDVLGDVEHVVDGGNGQTSVVIGHGGFLGLGEKQVAVSLDKVSMNRDRLVTRGLTDDQIRAMPAWKKGDAKELGGSHMVKVDTKS